MKAFLLIFRGGDAHRLNAQQSPEQWQAHMMKWKAWMDKLAEQDQLNGGQPLNNDGKVIWGTAKKITDGPFVEGKEIVGGYLLIKAKDINEATEISKGCPIFEHDGIVEVREIGSMTVS
jgi:hypothetical protein